MIGKRGPRADTGRLRRHLHAAIALLGSVFIAEQVACTDCSRRVRVAMRWGRRQLDSHPESRPLLRILKNSLSCLLVPTVSFFILCFFPALKKERRRGFLGERVGLGEMKYRPAHWPDRAAHVREGAETGDLPTSSVPADISGTRQPQPTAQLVLRGHFIAAL